MSLEIDEKLIGRKANFMNVKKYRANFKVESDETGFYASDMEQGIFTDGETEEELKSNIREAVACHFNVPSDQVEIILSQ